MFYIGWIALTAAGIWAGIGIFLWALKSGQFSDQGRARFLPLADEWPMTAPEDPSRPTVEVYVLLLVLAIGLIAMFSATALALFRWGG